MKKGLLTVLLASLVLVGCQNYDDQFDDLNAQISALKSQVDGLSALSGQVSSLSGTISGLQAGISAAQAAGAAATAAATAAGASADAATAAVGAIPEVDLSGLSASLTTLQAEVDAIEASIATTATAAEVAALQTSLTAVEADLADLLVSNNVYATDITINSAATMASALALGNKVALVNADVDITDDATIADADIQTFVNRIKTMNGDFRYDSGSTTGSTPTFDEMVAATTIDIEAAGDISFKALGSATTVTLATTYTTKITSLDMGAMTSVTTFSSGTDGSETANNLTLASATNVDLGALTMYNVASAADALTIAMKKGGTLDIASLTGTERTTALEEPLSLTISGPASLNLSKIADGTLTVSDVASLTVSGFYGTLDVNSGVETLTTTNTVLATLDGAVDVVTATLDFAYDWDPSLTTAQAAVADDLSNAGYLTDIGAAGTWVATDLKTLTVTGELLDLYMNETNLETLSIDATMIDLTLTGTTDLTSLTVASGSKIGNILVTGANNLAVADFNHTTNLDVKASGTTASTGADLAVSFQVYDNTALTTLHSTGDNVSTFTVAGNDALTAVDFTGLLDQGTATSATVRLWDNNLTATSAANTSDGDTDRADGLTTDLGSYDEGTSGMETLATYLGNIDGDADNNAFVTFDTVSSEVDTETSGTSTTTLNITGATGYTNGAGDTTETPTSTNQATILAMTSATANSADGGSDAIKAKQAFVLDWLATGTIQLTANSIPLFDTTVGGAGTALSIGTSNKDLQISAIESAVNLERAAAANVTLDAKRGYASSGTISLVTYASGGTTATQIGERYTTTTSGAAVSSTNFGFGLDEVLTLGVGSNTMSVSVTGGGQTVTTLTGVAAALVAGWAAKYGKAGTASASALATITASGGVLTITMLQQDSAGYDQLISLSSAAGSVTASNGKSLDWSINSSITDDNKTNDTDIIVTVESTVGGVDENTISTLTTTGGAGSTVTWVALATDYTTNTAYTTQTYAHVTVERTDVVSAEDSIAASASNAVAAVIFNRVAWLG